MNIIKRAIVTIILLPVFLEIGLRLFDPWGVGRYIDNLRQVYAAYLPDGARDFVMRPDHYQFNGWQATVLPDSTRLVPGTDTSASCRIALVGDSLTFGMSVNDEETWASLIARELPGVRVINAGVVNYQIDEVIATSRAYRADATLYLMVSNDNEERREMQPLPYVPYLYLYLRDLQDHPSGAQYMTDGEFYSRVGTLLDHGVRIVGFDEPLAYGARERYPAVTIIPMYRHRVSASDSHPDPAGNREIAAAILPIIKAAVRDRCTAAL